MLRPIPPHVAWQAITALAGVFTLASAFANPVDLWRLTVRSHQGEPFLATAILASLPQEHVSTACLSMGPESDAPDAELPFLAAAKLNFNAASSTVDISTDDPVVAPALALVLRVQCAGAPLYARHFSALIPPAARKIAQQSSAVQSPKRRGFRLSLLPGDTVESVAAAIFPGKRASQRELAQQVVKGNPNVFPDGRSRGVRAGTVLWFPDLRDLRKLSQEKTRSAAAPTSRHAAQTASRPLSESASARPTREVRAASRDPVTLRRALELGDKPGPQECTQLMQLCRGESAAAAVSPSLVEKTQALESGVKELHLKQDSIEQQLLRLEQSLQAMQVAVNAAPKAVAQPIAPPPKVEIRTLVKSEPVSWYVWLGLAALVVAAAIAGFASGRRGSLSRETVQTDEQLDRMLASAATVMRELESAPRPEPRAVPPLAAPTPQPRVPPAPPVQPAVEPAAASAPDAAGDMPSTQMPVDVKLESEPPAAPASGDLSSEVLYEMDQALDNTRSMFTDVDRFIALGRTQNALSLLQFQVHKDPKDRDSWIKLMAIYRQEKMDIELAKAVRQFKHNFPNEKSPSG